VVKDDRRFVNVREVQPDTTLSDIRVFEFDDQYRLKSISFAKEGRYLGNNTWKLREIVNTVFTAEGSSVQRLDEMDWSSVLTPDILAVMFIVPERDVGVEPVPVFAPSGREQAAGRALRDCDVEKADLSDRLTRHDGARAAFRLRSSARGGRGRQGVLGDHAGYLLPLHEQPLLPPWPDPSWQPFLTAVLPSVFFLGAATLMMWWVERR